MPLSQDLRHPIKVVCHRTGLTAHTIRVWERRYGISCGERSASNRRLYSDEEIEHLRLLAQLTQCGHRISQIAQLDTEALYSLLQQDAAKFIPDETPHLEHETPEECVQRCLEIILRLDAAQMSQILQQALLQYGTRNTLLQIISPLVQHVGEAWRKGDLRVVHEHFVTHMVRDFLALSSRCFPTQKARLEIIVTTPIGQIHEVGALLVAAAAREQGYNATYLGPALDANEIHAAVETRKAQVVALSTVYPSDDPQVLSEITRLRQLLAPQVKILLGGRAAFGYHQALRIPDVDLVHNFDDLDRILEQISLSSILIHES